MRRRQRSAANAPIPPSRISAAIGRAVPSASSDTPAAATPPSAKASVPINAEAVPARAA
mgnify:CR=1 FL=1